MGWSGRRRRSFFAVPNSLRGVRGDDVRLFQTYEPALSPIQWTQNTVCIEAVMAGEAAVLEESFRLGAQTEDGIAEFEDVVAVEVCIVRAVVALVRDYLENHASGGLERLRLKNVDDAKFLGHALLSFEAGLKNPDDLLAAPVRQDAGHTLHPAAVDFLPLVGSKRQILAVIAVQRLHVVGADLDDADVGQFFGFTQPAGVIEVVG